LQYTNEEPLWNYPVLRETNKEPLRNYPVLRETNKEPLRNYPVLRETNKEPLRSFAMKSHRLFFKNRTGAMLGARIDLPDGGSPPDFAIFAHCFTCTKNLKAIHNIDSALTGSGIGVLRFDFTGLGESEGDFAETNFSTNVEDLLSAADFLKSEYAAPKILIGHSLGGAAVLQSAQHIPSSAAVVTIAAPGEPVHLKTLLRISSERMAEVGEVEISLAGQTFKIKKQFIEDLDQTRMQDTIKNLNKALLIFHSPVDPIVDISNAASIFQSARHPKSFISLDRADHLLSDKRDSLYVGALIATWAQRYMK
jgi:putative redox protein